MSKYIWLDLEHIDFFIERMDCVQFLHSYSLTMFPFGTFSLHFLRLKKFYNIDLWLTDCRKSKLPPQRDTNRCVYFFQSQGRNENWVKETFCCSFVRSFGCWWLLGSMWPNSRLKSSRNCPKTCPKSSCSRFYLRTDGFQNSPKRSLNIWATFVWRICHKDI